MSASCLSVSCHRFLKINFLINVLSLDRNFVYLSKIYCAFFLFISSMFILLLKEMFALHQALNFEQFDTKHACFPCLKIRQKMCVLFSCFLSFYHFVKFPIYVLSKLSFNLAFNNILTTPIFYTTDHVCQLRED